MEGLIMAGQLILGLSILVTLHEFGHFITAKWFKMRVEKFYLFFDFLFPIPSLLNFALFKKKIGDTEYGLGWFPLGGYVSIAGMIDETQDAATLAKDPEPWEFRAKPAWQRLIVMLGGVIVNVITGVVIFISLTYSNGNNYISKEELNKNGIVALDLGKHIGLKTGDKIIKVNGADYKQLSDLRSSDVLLGDNSYYTVLRDGKEVNIQIPANFIGQLSDKKSAFIEPMTKFKVLDVTAPNPPSLLDKWLGKGSDEMLPALSAGLKAGDYITAVNQTPINFYHEIREVLSKEAGKPIRLAILRNGKADTLDMVVAKSGQIGFQADILMKMSHEDYSFGQSVGIGSKRAFSVITDNVRGFKKIATGDVSASKALSGPIGIAQMFGGVWDWTRFWMLTGLLSMALAFFNVLPIPALDGGHAIFLIYEIITGKPASDKVMERAQQIGMILLLGLMAYTFGNDIFKSFF
ncbi:Putative zinc metalloprotease [Aquirufa nivalisilvae]|uniref:Zinc metalloprotease n=1 Tax=Aquirufa nivalisilvae TaxID=2516557 RepID=A0A2S2DXW3_9BACT|nr:RIP metalloprotease RseP [Aquirufa nivalisilvae]AWL10142.1 Putative zinc metalloprotease [Aquirufa nivalisilvae]